MTQDSLSSSNKNPQSDSVEKQSMMERLGVALADWSERWFPDAYVFAAIAIVIVSIAALSMGRTPMQVSTAFGSSFWNLVPFTMQMAFVVIGGYVVAVSPPVHKLIVYLAKFPKSPKVAVAYVGFVAMITSLLSWGFSMIFAGMLMKEINARLKGVDYRAMGAAGYLGLGSVWALGLSSSAALLMATQSSIPKELYAISGVIGLDQTLFTWQNLVLIVALVVVSTWVCYASCPVGSKAKTIDSIGIGQDDPSKIQNKATRPGEVLEYSPILTLVIVALGFAYLADVFATKGFLQALELPVYNLMFLVAGMLLHWHPRAFLRAVGKAIPMTGGVIVQFPLYAGIFGILMSSGLNEVLADFFVRISTKETLPVIGGIYSAILGFFLPSGGGKWVVEAPYILSAAKNLDVNLAWMVQVYNAAEALPNFINPFWMLPLLGLTGIKARDLAGFSMLQLILHTPIVLFLLWLLGLTF